MSTAETVQGFHGQVLAEGQADPGNSAGIKLADTRHTLRRWQARASMKCGAGVLFAGPAGHRGAFRRSVKTQGSLPSEDAVLALLFGLVATGTDRVPEARRLAGHGDSA
jgi:hypothetical protein